MLELLGANARVALANKVAILDKLDKFSSFLGKIVDIATENIELAAAVAEVSTCISLAKKYFYLEDLA